MLVAPSFSGKGASSSGQGTTLGFAERVAYQRAIEEVYWRHRIWPKENSSPKPSLDALMTQAQLEKKVTDYLQKSETLADYWHRPVTAEPLQAEMDRMGQHTKQPDVLRELFAALGNDPFVIAECLSRPALAERSIMNWHSYDQIIDGEFAQNTRQLICLRIQCSLANTGSRRIIAPTAGYRLSTISVPVSACIDDNWMATITINAPSPRGGHTAVWTGSEMIVWGGVDAQDSAPLAANTIPPRISGQLPAPLMHLMADFAHTAVWTGSEMIVWGGAGTTSLSVQHTVRQIQSQPRTRWTATSTANAPSSSNIIIQQFGLAAEMIVWGGSDRQRRALNTGGRYDPSTDSWTATSTANAPAARDFHHQQSGPAGEMIVWVAKVQFTRNLGHWREIQSQLTILGQAPALANAPEGRLAHTAIWTGKQHDRLGRVTAGPTLWTPVGDMILRTNQLDSYYHFERTKW